MPIKKAAQFTAWSYSRLHDYEECPLKAKLKHLDKVKEPDSPALANGSKVHKEAEDFGTGRLKKLPESLKRFGDEFKELAKHRKHLSVERQLAADASWEASDWFAPNTWVRVVLDAEVALDERLKVIDYKTGKVRPENVQQLDLYAPVAFAHAPKHIKVVEAELWYLDQGELIARSYTRPEADKLKRDWEKRVKKMLVDTSFKPNPGNACRWCWFSQAAKRDKGGPGLCKY